MTAPLLLATLLTAGASGAPLVPCPAGPALPAPVMAGDDDLRALYDGGQSYDDFLAGADRRVELWRANTEKSEAIDPELVRRARAVGGTWRLLAVAVPSCSDSVSIIPYLARLAAMVDGLELRIVDNRAGRAVMEAHPTPDGRPATPTVVLLDADWSEAGCFIERPPALQTWILDNDEDLSSDEIFSRKMAWYAEDAGQQTLEAIVETLEAAARGDVICR